MYSSLAQEEEEADEETDEEEEAGRERKPLMARDSPTASSWRKSTRSAPATVLSRNATGHSTRRSGVTRGFVVQMCLVK